MRQKSQNASKGNTKNDNPNPCSKDQKLFEEMNIDEFIAKNEEKLYKVFEQRLKNNQFFQKQANPVEPEAIQEVPTDYLNAEITEKDVYSIRSDELRKDGREAPAKSPFEEVVNGNPDSRRRLSIQIEPPANEKDSDLSFLEKLEIMNFKEDTQMKSREDIDDWERLVPQDEKEPSMKDLNLHFNHEESIQFLQ